MAKILMGISLCGAMACGQPCRELRQTICDCMPSRQEQQACGRRIKALVGQQSAQQRPTPKQEAVCQELLATCTCEALAAGDFVACGLATESLAAP